MNCAACGHENRQAARFCESCGAGLERQCSACGAAARADATFCDQCGTRLAEAGVPESAAQARVEPASQATGTAAQRRQLTVLYCDIAAAGASADALEAERLRERIRSCQRLAAARIEKHGGYVAQLLASGLLAYFGYPKAHEDDAAHALRAALDVSRIAARDVASEVRPLELRIGLHTGPAVVGDPGGRREEQLALGDTPLLATRLTEVAAPGQILASAATHRLVEGRFECRSRGLETVRGIAAPVSAFEVTAETAAHSRFEAMAQAGLPPLIARDAEMRVLREHWARSRNGAGQVVVISGEAGIGKSRLLREIVDVARGEGALCMEFRCAAEHQDSALHPAIARLERILRFAPGDSDEEKLAKLSRVLARHDFVESDTLAILAALLALPVPVGGAALLASPERARRRTLQALIAWMVEETRRAPICCSFEDLHWADPSTLALIDAYLDQVPNAPILVLLTQRPDSGVHLPARSYVSQITLGRLARAAALDVLAGVTHGKPLPEEVTAQLLEKTDGVPLFVEELARMLLESSLLQELPDRFELTGPLPPLAVPATLQDSLMARLDHMAASRDVAQLAAALGREFSYGLLRDVAGRSEDTLKETLAELVRGELLQQKGVPPNARYGFRHALIRDAAYESMLISKRQMVHDKVAGVLEAQPEVVATQPELLAHHYSEAGLAAQALPYWLRAGQLAVSRFAGTEALRHFRKGLELLAALPDDPTHAELELDLETNLGQQLMAVKGYAAPEVEGSYARAQVLCERLPESPRRFRVLEGLWGFRIVRGELQSAHRLAKRLLALADAQGEPAQRLEAHYAQSAASFYMGHFGDALAHAEMGCDLYDPERHRRGALQDTGVACHCYAAWSLWNLDRGAEARRHSAFALQLARDLDHPISVAWALDFAAMLRQHEGDVSGASRCAEEAIAICRDHGFSFWLALARMIHGWCLTQSSKDDTRDAGEAELRRGLAAWQTTGAQLAIPYWLGLLAGVVVGDSGEPRRVADGLAMVGDALDKARAGEDRFYEVELLRLRGRYQRALGDASTADATFHEALARAAAQGAIAWRRRVEATRRSLSALPPSGGLDQDVDAR